MGWRREDPSLKIDLEKLEAQTEKLELAADKLIKASAAARIAARELHMAMDKVVAERRRSKGTW